MLITWHWALSVHIPCWCPYATCFLLCIFDAVLLVERLSELPTSFCQLTHLQVHPGQQRIVQTHCRQMCPHDISWCFVRGIHPCRTFSWVQQAGRSQVWPLWFLGTRVRLKSEFSQPDSHGQLQRLDASCNRLQWLPDDLGNLGQSLLELRLSQNILRKLPDTWTAGTLGPLQ